MVTGVVTGVVTGGVTDVVTVWGVVWSVQILKDHWNQTFFLIDDHVNAY